MPYKVHIFVAALTEDQKETVAMVSESLDKFLKVSSTIFKVHVPVTTIHIIHLKFNNF